MNASRFAPLLAGGAVVLALATAPAFAQNNAQPGNAGAAGTAPAVGTVTPGPGAAPPAAGGINNPAAGGVAAGNTMTPNPVLVENGDIRASKVIGSAVFNDKNQQVGSVDDILLAPGNQPAKAILKVGSGAFGLGGKLVEVPFSQLQFPMQIGANTGRVLMPGATENGLTGMPEFHYASR